VTKYPVHRPSMFVQLCPQCASRMTTMARGPRDATCDEISYQCAECNKGTSDRLAAEASKAHWPSNTGYERVPLNPLEVVDMSGECRQRDLIASKRYVHDCKNDV
jgi:DNA-directed RNA polymerase subunit RPC12/RpoP